MALSGEATKHGQAGGGAVRWQGGSKGTHPWAKTTKTQKKWTTKVPPDISAREIYRIVPASLV